MKKIIFLVPLFLIVKTNGSERDLEKAPILMRSVESYSALSLRSLTPDIPLEQQTEPEMKKRKTTLITAISAKDIALVKSSFEKDFAWVNTLYLQQAYASKQIPQTTHEALQQKFLFTQKLFSEIDEAIAKEDARQEWLRKLSRPGQIITACSECGNEDSQHGCICTTYWPQWSNISLSVLALMLAAIYCKTHYPSRLSTSDPCAILPPGQQAQMFLNCTESSLKTRFPCVIFDTHNSTQIKMMEDCCENLIDLFCMQFVDHYNDQVYPTQVWHAWRPAAIVLPSILAVQGAFQLGGYLYRRSKRLQDPIKELIVRKKTDFSQIEQDFEKLTIMDNSSFQAL